MRHLPNILCWSRIALTPVCVWLLLTGRCGLAVPVTLFTGFTDLFDGLLARRLRVESRFGAWLDPVADKILLTSLYISFGIGGAIPGWLVWLVVGRDVVILGMVAIGLLFTQIRDFPPTIWGKLSTVIQIGGVLVLLAGCASWETASILRDLTVWAVTIGTGWSGVHYVWRGGVMLRASR